MTKSAPVIVDTTHSPFARLHPIALTEVQLRDAFWEPRRQTNRDLTLPSQYQQLVETGRIDNFRRAAGHPEIPFRGIFFNDSDVYKWLEAVAWTLATDPTPELVALADSVIAQIAAAQQPDGYLNTYFVYERSGERWTNFDKHEMYCAGHMIQAAVAHYRATGSTALLDVATRLADYLDRTFGPEEQGKRVYADGHEEIELALVELYRATGERRYLELAQFFVDVRGHNRLKHPEVHFNTAYYQDSIPFREMSEVGGHAVRMVYYAGAGADLAAEKGEPAIQHALDRLWGNMVSRRMYVNGGLGSRYEGEAFGGDYELPNDRAYAETCAAIGGLMWAWRMLMLSGDASYTDALENILYNAVLPGISLKGDTYFYQNPLADDGKHRRQPWFGTACCPPNIARLLASLPGYLYSSSEEGLWVHLYATNTLQTQLADGTPITLTQQTGYPFDGEVNIEVGSGGHFTLFLRIPGWSTDASLSINQQLWDGKLVAGTYAAIERDWQAGDRIRLQLPMPVQFIQAHPYASAQNDQVAIKRGPLLYCVEEVDYPGADLRSLVLPLDSELAAGPAPLDLPDVVSIHGTALQEGTDWNGELYRPLVQSEPSYKPARLIAIPYYAWANRAAGKMRVWLRAKR